MKVARSGLVGDASHRVDSGTGAAPASASRNRDERRAGVRKGQWGKLSSGDAATRLTETGAIAQEIPGPQQIFWKAGWDQRVCKNLRPEDGVSTQPTTQY